MKKEEIKELSVQELKVAHAITPSGNPAKITSDRRHIARLKTILRQKELAAAAAAPSAE